MILQKIMTSYWDEVLSDVNKEQPWHAYYLEASFSTIKSIRICKLESWQNQKTLDHWACFTANIWTGKPWDHAKSIITDIKGPPPLVIQSNPCLGICMTNGKYKYVNLTSVYPEGGQTLVYTNDKITEMTVMIRKIKLEKEDDKK